MSDVFIENIYFTSLVAFQTHRAKNVPSVLGYFQDVSHSVVCSIKYELFSHKAPHINESTACL